MSNQSSDDELVTLEVPAEKASVQAWAKSLWNHPLGDAARRWVEAHDRPERRFLALGQVDGSGYVEWDARKAVAVEDLQPGDRVAGREVVETRLDHAHWVVDLTFDSSDAPTRYGLGTLVVLDGDR